MKIINTRALTGETVRIRNAPRPAPTNAPTIGTSAVNAISAPIIAGYGIFNIYIPTVHKAPKITASVH